MKRLYSLFLAVLVCSLFCAKAEYKKDTVNNMIFTGEWSNNAIVVEDDSLVYNTVYFDYRNANFPRDSLIQLVLLLSKIFKGKIIIGLLKTISKYILL